MKQNYSGQHAKSLRKKIAKRGKSYAQNSPKFPILHLICTSIHCTIRYLLKKIPDDIKKINTIFQYYFTDIALSWDIDQVF